MKINDTVKWISAIIIIFTFFSGIIIAMNKNSTNDIKITGEENKSDIIELKIKQTALQSEIYTKLDNIQEDIKEIKEALRSK